MQHILATIIVANSRRLRLLLLLLQLAPESILLNIWCASRSALPELRALRVRVGVYVRSRLLPRDISQSFKLPTEICPHHSYRDDPLHSREDTRRARHRTPCVSQGRLSRTPRRAPRIRILICKTAEKAVEHAHIFNADFRETEKLGNRWQNRRNTLEARAALSSILYVCFPPTSSWNSRSTYIHVIFDVIVIM